MAWPSEITSKRSNSQLRQKRWSLMCLTSVQTLGSPPWSPLFVGVMSRVISLICIMPKNCNLQTTLLSIFIKTTDMPLIGTDTGSHYCRWGGCRPLSGCLSAVLCFLRTSTEEQCSHRTIRTQLSDVLRCMAFCWEQIRWDMLINMRALR